MVLAQSWTARKGQIERVILLGGGALLLETLRNARKMGFSAVVVTDPRHERESVEGSLFRDLAGRLNPEEYHCISGLEDDPRWKRLIDPERTLGISFGAVWIFKKPVIEGLFAGNLLNCHGADLPYDRGGGGASWRILRGDRRCRSIVHLVDEGVDTGPILYSHSYEFPENCKIPADHYRYQIQKDAAFVAEFLKKIQGGFEFLLEQQDNSRSTTWPRLHTDTHGAIDWRLEGKEICRFIRAFDDPYAGAFTFLGREKVRLKGAEENSETFHPFQAGMIYRVFEGRSYIACGKGSVSVSQILGNRSRIPLGDRLWTPLPVLETAMMTRVSYLPNGTERREMVTA